MRDRRRWHLWGGVLGFAVGGFFDGILLHQILQWHHLLSLVPGMADLRTQVLWDGYFHALMYAVAATGLWGLWQARGEAQARPGQPLAGAMLVGFGLWHVVDGVASHWLLGIHRIRLDSADPLFWDVAWLVGFGLVPAAAGWWLSRRPPGPGRPVVSPTVAVVLAGVLAGGGAAWSLRPAAESGLTTVAFAPGVRPAAALNAVLAAGGRIVWSDPAVSVVVADLPEDRRWRLYGRGALLVSGAGLPAGCAGWSRI